jgi:plasmid stabilization system protein ParE
MAYGVKFRPRAEHDLETLFRKLVQEAPLRGPEWVTGLEAIIYSLGEMPERCPVVRELSKPDIPVRQLLYGRYPHVYKVYYTVESMTVWILHIRHGARKKPKPHELFPPAGQ